MRKLAETDGLVRRHTTRMQSEGYRGGVIEQEGKLRIALPLMSKRRRLTFLSAGAADLIVA